LLFEPDDETELTNPKGLGISAILCKGIPKLAKIGKPDFMDVCLM